MLRLPHAFVAVHLSTLSLGLAKPFESYSSSSSSSFLPSSSSSSSFLDIWCPQAFPLANQCLFQILASMVQATEQQMTASPLSMRHFATLAQLVTLLCAQVRDRLLNCTAFHAHVSLACVVVVVVLLLLFLVVVCREQQEWTCFHPLWVD